MTKVRRFIAGMLAAVSLAAFSACGYNTRSAFTIDDLDIPAGIYIQYMVGAVNEAYSITGDSETKIFDQQVEGQNASDWIKNNAKENCLRYAAVEKEFDNLGLSFTAEEEEEIKTTTDNYWNGSTPDAEGNQILNSDLSTAEGISKESISLLMRNGYKKQKIFDAYYAEGGSEEVTESELKDYFYGEYNQVTYLSFALTDTAGTALDDAAKKELKDKADAYAERINNGENIEDIGAEYAREVDEASAATDDGTSSAADTSSADEEEKDYTNNSYTSKEILMPKPGSKASENTSYAEELVQGTEDLKIGEAKVIEAESYYYVVFKLDLEADAEAFDTNKEGILQRMKNDEFNDRLLEMGKGLTINENSAAIRRYKPEKLKTIS